MVSKKLNKYRLFCQTEGVFKTVWNNSEPKKCPDAAQHTIDPNSVTIVDAIVDNTVTIENNYVNTNGNYMMEGFQFQVPAQSNYTFTTSKPFDVMCYNVYLHPTQSNVGDNVSLYAQFTLPISGIVHSGESNVQISPSLLTNIQKGYDVTLSNATSCSHLGMVVSMDTNSICTQYSASNTYRNNDTLVLRKYYGKSLSFPIVPNTYCVGQGTLNGTFIPASTPMYLDYNNVNLQPKPFVFHVECMY